MTTDTEGAWETAWKRGKDIADSRAATIVVMVAASAAWVATMIWGLGKLFGKGEEKKDAK